MPTPPIFARFAGDALISIRQKKESGLSTTLENLFFLCCLYQLLYALKQQT
jgi:hypothetical protein